MTFVDLNEALSDPFVRFTEKYDGCGSADCLSGPRRNAADCVAVAVPTDPAVRYCLVPVQQGG